MSKVEEYGKGLNIKNNEVKKWKSDVYAYLDIFNSENVGNVKNKFLVVNWIFWFVRSFRPEALYAERI